MRSSAFLSRWIGPSLVVACSVCSTLLAQDTPKRAYGTFESVMQLSSAAFHPADPGTEVQESEGYVHAVPGGGRLFAPLNLPTGAAAGYLVLCYKDTDAASGLTHDVSADLFEFTGSSSPSSSLIATVTSTSNGVFSPGCSSVGIPPGHQISNLNQYMVYVHNTDTDKSFKGVWVVYRLQMSPAPATATFGDVPTTHLYFRAIEALHTSGITGGCGEGLFCPSGYVTRGEMAALLARALGLGWPE